MGLCTGRKILCYDRTISCDILCKLIVWKERCKDLNLVRLRFCWNGRLFSCRLYTKSDCSHHYNHGYDTYPNITLVWHVYFLLRPYIKLIISIMLVCIFNNLQHVMNIIIIKITKHV